jgi:hypothetical protein
MTNLTLKEHMLITEARREDLKYIEKKVKDQLERVTLELHGAQSAPLTKLAARYDRLNKAIKTMGEQRDKLNEDIKGKVEDLFAAEDVVLTRVIDTVSFTMTVSRKTKTADKTVVDYEKIAGELAKLIPDELQPKVDEIVKAYSTLVLGQEKSPALQVKAKVAEGLLSDLGSKLANAVKTVVKSVASWAKGYDKKLSALKKEAKVPVSKSQILEETGRRQFTGTLKVFYMDVATRSGAEVITDDGHKFVYDRIPKVFSDLVPMGPDDKKPRHVKFTANADGSKPLNASIIA